MIDFVEIRDANDSNKPVIGIIDMAKSIIWHRVYYGVGDFEIYIPATPENVAMLQVGNYVTRQNDEEVGVIEGVTIDFTVQDGYMITAVGRFAKSILDRRIIYKLNGTVNTPTILRGKVEVAVRQAVIDNAISCSFDSRRNIPDLGLAALKNLTPTIVGEDGETAAEKQVSYQNLMEYTDQVLQEYGLSANVILNNSNRKLLYSVFQGTDRSTNNEDGNEPVVFSVDFDNLNSSSYLYNEQNLKNAALIGGEGEGLERFYSLLTASESGLQLREMFVDASTINRKYEVEGQEEPVEYTVPEYRALLNQEAQREMKETIVQESFNGGVNVTYGLKLYGRDYFLGDIVTVQDNNISKYINTRITEVTEVQDDNGYSVDVVFGD